MLRWVGSKTNRLSYPGNARFSSMDGPWSPNASCYSLTKCTDLIECLLVENSKVTMSLERVRFNGRNDIERLKANVNTLCELVHNLVSEDTLKQALMDASDVIAMFGFHVFGKHWKRVCHDLSNERLETIAKTAVPTVDLVGLRAISRLRNRQCHRDLSSLQKQRQFLRDMGGRVWPQELRIVEPCISYLKTRS